MFLLSLFLNHKKDPGGVHMTTVKPHKPQSYSKKIDKNSPQLLVFYNMQAQLSNTSWSLNGFLNNGTFIIKEVTFMQGVDRQHDSFHVWYVHKDKNDQ